MSAKKTRLKKIETQIKRLENEKKQIEEEIKKRFIPDQFNLKDCLFILDDPCSTRSKDALEFAFNWESTIQGHTYWEAISYGRHDFSDLDIQSIQTWVINYLMDRANIDFPTW